MVQARSRLNTGTVARRGRLTLPEDRRDYLRALLLNEFQSHAGFLKAYIDFLSRYERLLEALPRVTDPPLGQGTGVNPETDWGALRGLISSRSRLIHLRQYREDIEALCHQWGLRCPWAASWVHTASLRWANAGISYQEIFEHEGDFPSEMVAFVRERAAEKPTPLRRLPWLNSSIRRWTGREGESVVPMFLVPPHFQDCGWLSSMEASKRFEYLLDRASVRWPSPKIEFEYNAFLDFASVKKKAVEETRRQWEKNRRESEAAGFTLESTKPVLPLHVHWLFLRICPQDPYGRPLGWSIIAEREYKTVDTVRVPVRLLAKELEISLPPLPPGPHPKFRH